MLHDNISYHVAFPFSISLLCFISLLYFFQDAGQVIVQIGIGNLTDHSIDELGIKGIIAGGQADIEYDIAVIRRVKFEYFVFLIALIDEIINGSLIPIVDNLGRNENAQHNINTVVDEYQERQPLTFDFDT